MHKVLVFLISSICLSAHAQKTDSTNKFNLSLEFRPRFEYRDGYKKLPQNSQNFATFISNRTRLNLDYQYKKTSFYASVQDVRIWGQNQNSPANNGLSVFEAYSKFSLNKNASIALGRQAVELDNARLFSRANWNQSSQAHDGIKFNYKPGKFNLSTYLFYNQSHANNFGTQYSTNYYKPEFDSKIFSEILLRKRI